MATIRDLSTIKSAVRISDIIGQTLSIKKQTKDEYVGKCPFHNDNTPSFHIYNATCRYHCFGCGQNGDVFEWLHKIRGMSLHEASIFLDGEDMAQKNNPVEKEIITPLATDDDSFIFKITPGLVHYYRDSDNNLLYKVGRYEAKDGQKKYFLPATHTKDGWIAKAPTEGRIIYNLPRMLSTLGLVILVAGEKKCDQLQAILPNNAVISWMGGDKAFGKTNWHPIADRKIVFWPDNDEVSKDVQHEIKCEKLWIVQIPDDMPKGWDAGDAIEGGWGINDVMQLISNKVLYDDLKTIAVHPPQEESNKYQLPGKLHGLCGDIEEWINSTAYKKQPLLAINASLVFVGALKGQRVCTERNLLTNMYALSLGESGCGKDHPRQCLEVLANSVGLQDSMMAGVPASGTALVKSVKRNGRCLIQIDELGRVIGNITGKNAGGYQREIVDNMMMLYSSASTLFREKEYAVGREDKEKNAIIKPCLCVHAMTVPERFYNNLTTDDVIDGFLSRWMIVASNDPDPDEADVEVDIDDIPESIIERVNLIQNMPVTNKISELPVTEQQIRAIQYSITPKVIQCTPEAKSILSRYKAIARGLKNDLRKQGSALNALWVRMGENAHKIALIVQDGDTITGTDMQWACQWVMYWTQYSIDQVKEKLSDNEQDKRTKEIYSFIRKNPGVTKSAITKRTFSYGKRMREEILDTLIESEKVRFEDEPTSSKPIRRYFPC